MQTQTRSNKIVSHVHHLYLFNRKAIVSNLTFPWRANSCLMKLVRQQMNFNNCLEIQVHGTFLKITNCLSFVYFEMTVECKSPLITGVDHFRNQICLLQVFLFYKQLHFWV